MYWLADLGFLFILGDSVTLSESVSTLEGLFVFVMVVFFSKHSRLRKGLNEPMDRRTLTIRFIGIIIATFGSIGIVLGAR